MWKSVSVVYACVGGCVCVNKKTAAVSVRGKKESELPGETCCLNKIRSHQAQVSLTRLMRTLCRDPDPAQRQRETSNRQGTPSGMEGLSHPRCLP